MTLAQVSLTRVLCAAPFVFSCLLVVATAREAYTQRPAAALRSSPAEVPQDILLRIVRAEDERRWDADLSGLLSDSNAAVRGRAALAAGRIGDERSVPSLVALLQDKDDEVKAWAAFALGETESPAAGDALLTELTKRGPARERARILEALGKITGTLPATDETRVKSFRGEIYAALEFEAARRSAPDTEVILLGLTAALRARPAGVGKVIAEFLTYSDARIRADAANALARLRANDGNEQLRKLLTADPDPTVRANAARVLGATEDKEALDGLLDRALKDTDSRVRVSAIRAIAAFKDDPAASPLFGNFLENARCQRHLLKRGAVLSHHRDAECLEFVTTLGRVFQGTGNKKALERVDFLQVDFAWTPPELGIALVRISPEQYLKTLGDEATAKSKAQNAMLQDWREASSLAQALGEIAALPDSTKNKKQLGTLAETVLRGMLDYPRSNVKRNEKADQQAEYALPDVLRAFAAFKTNDLDAVLSKHLSEPDVVVRATAAELVAELAPTETNTRALGAALPVALADKVSNDAAIAIVDALGKQKNQAANEALKLAVDTSDYPVRRRAVAYLKVNGAGDFSARIGSIETRNTAADYQRALARIGKKIEATVNTELGSFVIELLPENAPLNVDNFVRLAKRRYFNGISFHRVVPNFVIQGGDPRGDGNGGPGYQIRCEINQVPYERGTVGMALSGKDTGGSQWFVTHSRQPHLDGGYTVFGRVVSGMEVVDTISRGDIIRDIVITETGRARKTSTRRRTPKSGV